MGQYYTALVKRGDTIKNYNIQVEGYKKGGDIDYDKYNGIKLMNKQTSSLCPHCGADLNKEGVGYDSHCYQVTYPDGGCGDLELGDVIEYYCPLCGEKLPARLAWEIVDKWNGEE